MKPLNVQKLINNAEKEVGLNYWGDDEFREPLIALVDAINNEAALNDHGYELAEQRLNQRLCQRLKLFDDRKRYPEIAQQKIEKPVMVVGLPRAGTTYTHSLLGADPANIAPVAWQLFYPSPPPNNTDFSHSESISQAKQLVESQGWMTPDVKRTHNFDAMHPDECSRAFELSFQSLSLVGYWNIPSYYSALEVDCTAAYETHKKVLQALQFGTQNRRWVLKAPEHTTQLEYLLKVYPDAVLVQNHRDPSRVMASLASIITSLHSLSTDHVPEVGREFMMGLVQSFADGQERLIEMRKDPAIDKHFIDVHYLELERAPIGVMQRIYQGAGLPFNESSERSINHWIETNRKGKHGKHKYSLCDVSVEQAEIHAMFKNYIERFNIELEPEI